MPTLTPQAPAAGPVPALLPVVGHATPVPLIGGGTVPYANFDGAASAPALVAVADQVAQALPWYASVHRGAGYLSQVSTTLYEQARAAVARYVGARRDDVAVITRNTTDALNLLATVVPGRVLVTDVEHHANLIPWQRTPHGATRLTAQDTVRATLDAIAAELAARPYALVAVTGASNVTGEALPLADVIALAHRHGARVVVDGAQLLAHRALSLADSGADYVAFSGHKLYAPYGAGALVGRRDWLDDGEPYLAGGGAVRRVPGERDEPIEWAPAPARHEAGTPNLLGAVALATACDTLAALPPRALEDHEDALRARLLAGLAAIAGVRVVRLWSDSAEPVGVVTFTVSGIGPGLVAAALAAEHGLGVRDGRFCAHPLLDRLGLADGGVRVSLGVGTTSEEVDRLLAGLRAIAEDGPRGAYEVVNGCWTVVDDPRPRPEVTGIAELVATAAACAVQSTSSASTIRYA